MADGHPLEEIVTRPGVYFNPQTEVLIVVDDSAELDAEIFNMEEFEGADWVQISDETPIDEHRRDELLEDSRPTTTPATRAASRATAERARGERATTRRTSQEVGTGVGRPVRRYATRTPNASATIR